MTEDYLSYQPRHILKKIGKHLDSKALCNFSQTSKQIKRHVGDLVQKATHTKELQDFLNREFIPLPDGYNPEDEDNNSFYWSPGEDPIWDPERFNINQIFILNEGLVHIISSNCSNITLEGPVTLKEFIKRVNNGLRREAKRTGRDISRILDDHHFPEGLRQYPGNVYGLFYGS